MPSISDVTAHVEDLARTVKTFPGVTRVYLHGSCLSHAAHPSYPLNDIDLIAVTTFDSGDLMAIDAGPESPLKMASREWEDLGFNPDAVNFTKHFLSMRQFNVDPWVSSSDGKILHWGPMPETIDEWTELHKEAETFAQGITGYNRLKLAKTSDQIRNQWREAYKESLNRGLSKTQQLLGWLPSDHPAEDILAVAKPLA